MVYCKSTTVASFISSQRNFRLVETFCFGFQGRDECIIKAHFTIISLSVYDCVSHINFLKLGFMFHSVVGPTA